MNLRIEQDGRLRRITLAAPEKRNLLDAELCRDLLRSNHKANAHILQTGSEFGSLRAGRSVKAQARATRSGSRVTRCR